jgi:hypothetical protein
VTTDPSAWTRETGVTCVVCPGCAFTFDAFHTENDGSGYDCPACAEHRITVALLESERQRQAALALVIRLQGRLPYMSPVTGLVGELRAALSGAPATHPDAEEQP